VLKLRAISGTFVHIQGLMSQQ